MIIHHMQINQHDTPTLKQQQQQSIKKYMISGSTRGGRWQPF